MTDIDNPEIQVLQSDQCPSLSGRSTLTFELSTDPAKRLHLRVTHNTGKGHHNPAWVAYDQIEPLLMQAPTLSAAALATLFQGTSVNTAGFVMAVLKHLGAIEAIPEQRHAYRPTDTTDWKVRMRALIESAGGPVGQEGGQASTSERSRSRKDDKGRGRRGATPVPG